MGVEHDSGMEVRAHSPKRIDRKLREVDWLLAEGSVVAVAVQHLEFSEATHCRRRNQFGGMNPKGA